MPRKEPSLLIGTAAHYSDCAAELAAEFRARLEHEKAQLRILADDAFALFREAGTFAARAGVAGPASEPEVQLMPPPRLPSRRRKRAPPTDLTIAAPLHKRHRGPARKAEAHVLHVPEVRRSTRQTARKAAAGRCIDESSKPSLLGVLPGRQTRSKRTAMAKAEVFPSNAPHTKRLTRATARETRTGKVIAEDAGPSVSEELSKGRRHSTRAATSQAVHPANVPVKTRKVRQMGRTVTAGRDYDENSHFPLPDDAEINESSLAISPEKEVLVESPPTRRERSKRLQATNASVTVPCESPPKNAPNSQDSLAERQKSSTCEADGDVERDAHSVTPSTEKAAARGQESPNNSNFQTEPETQARTSSSPSDNASFHTAPGPDSEPGEPDDATEPSSRKPSNEYRTTLSRSKIGRPSDPPWGPESSSSEEEVSPIKRESHETEKLLEETKEHPARNIQSGLSSAPELSDPEEETPVIRRGLRHKRKAVEPTKSEDGNVESEQLSPELDRRTDKRQLSDVFEISRANMGIVTDALPAEDASRGPRKLRGPDKYKELRTGDGVPKISERSRSPQVRQDDDAVKMNLTSSEQEVQDGEHEIDSVQNAEISSEARVSNDHVEYKVPKLPRRRKAEVGKPSSTNSSVPDSSLSARKRVERAAPQDLFVHRPRFVVDENGRLGNASIGALSQIASTPSNTNSGGQVLAPHASDPRSSRGPRLHRPTTSIYSVSKKPVSSVLKARSSRPAAILRTPGVGTPLKKTSSKRSVAFQDASTVSWMRPSAAEHSLEPRKTDGYDDEIKSSVLSTLARQTPTQDPEADKENVKTDFDEEAQGSSDIDKKKKKLAFANTPESPSTRSKTAAFATRNSESSSPVMLRESSRGENSLPEPRTAPGPGPRERIEGKQVKSALRQRIESLRAGKIAPRIICSASDSMSPNDSRKQLDHAGSSAGIAKLDPNGKNALQGRSASAFKPISDTDARGKELYRTSTTAGPRAVLTREEQAPETQPRDASIAFALPDRLSDGTPSIRTSGSNPQQSQAELNAVRNHSLEVSSERPAVHMERLTASNESESDRAMKRVMDSQAISKAATNTVGESLTPEVETVSAGGNEETKNTVPSGRVNDIEKPHQNAISNLVSSVATFLPGTSSFFNTKVEERTPEDEAEVERKRQKQEAERREAELLARKEAARVARQAEAAEKQRKAEQRRRILQEAARHKEEERKRKEEQRAKKRQEEHERQRKQKENELREKEERRRRVLEHKKKMDKEAEKKELQRRVKEKGGKGKMGVEGGSKLKPFRPGQTHSRLPPSGAGSSKILKPVTADRMGSQPPKTPKMQREVRQEEVTSYEMTAERRRDSETSGDAASRRRKKVVPSWAATEQLMGSLVSQKADPDALFARVHSCNLEDVFNDGPERKRYKPRSSSGNWTRDRLTAKEELEFKRKQGYFDKP